MLLISVFVCKQKTAYEVRISDWSSDVCSSDLHIGHAGHGDFALADADGFHDHEVVARCLAYQHSLARLLRHTTQRSAGRAGTDKGLLHRKRVVQDTGRPVR